MMNAESVIVPHASFDIYEDWTGNHRNKSIYASGV